jgi:CheY-like chemotaxis protein
MRPTILLVDDEPAIRNLLAHALDKHGYDVSEAADGVEALAVARDMKRIDAVVSDICMPYLNGFAMAAELRVLFPDVHFVFISGYPVDHSLIGKNAMLLTKPFLPTELYATIAAASSFSH